MKNNYRKNGNVDVVQTTRVLKMDQCKSYKLHWTVSKTHFDTVGAKWNRLELAGPQPGGGRRQSSFDRSRLGYFAKAERLKTGGAIDPTSLEIPSRNFGPTASAAAEGREERRCLETGSAAATSESIRPGLLRLPVQPLCATQTLSRATNHSTSLVGT